MKKIIDILFSTRLMAVLFLLFPLTMGIATFIENSYNTQTARKLVYNTTWFEWIMLFFVINFVGNIFKYKLHKKEKWTILLLHLSFVFILVGAGITRYIGYEAKMPILEGETTNVALSERSYLTVNVDNGKEQKGTFEKEILLSAWKNNFGNGDIYYHNDFRGKAFEVNLVDYIPNHTKKFTENPVGENYIHLVESNTGSRHDHYIKKGTTEIIHNIAVGYESTNKNAIDFKDGPNGLQITSVNDGTYFRMSDKFNGTVKKDSLQDLQLLSLHNLVGLQFVVPEGPVKGEYKVIIGDKEEDPYDLLTFEVKTKKETKKVEVIGRQYGNGRPEIVTVDDLKFTIQYGAKMVTLPFSVKLNDFQLETHPGSQSPASFASEVTVVETSEADSFNYRIFMNHILNYKGFKLFQSSYSPPNKEGKEETILQVNHDYWGSTITYIGYFALYLGLLLILFSRNTRFSVLKKGLEKIDKQKRNLATLLLLTCISGFAQNGTNVKKEFTLAQIDSIVVAEQVDKAHALKFSKLTIQDTGGRMKPVHTFASELLRKVSKRDNFNGLDANQVFLSIVQNPRFWFHVPIIYIDRHDTKIRDIIGIPHDQRRATLSDFFDRIGNYKIAEAQEKAFKKANKSVTDKELILVDERATLLYQAIGGGILKIFPLVDDPNNTWIAHQELNEANYKGTDSVFVKQILPAYIQILQDAKKTNDYTESNNILDGIDKFQEKYGSAVKPSKKKIEMEVLYNEYDIFKTLYRYYLLAGLLLIVFYMIRVFRDGKILHYLSKLMIGIIIICLILHTAGLAIRWFLSGHAPWSNAYESIIYVAWAVMAFGINVGRKSSLTIGATAFVTAMTLYFAHQNWLDPAIGNLVPVLNSWWLMVHVSIIVGSYGPFTLSMALGFVCLLLYIFTTKNNKRKLQLQIRELTIINEMSLTVGLIMLTIGNFLGGMWANESWGRYWGWDPKETWALISIFIYAFVLHVRLIPGLKSRLIFNVLSVLAFLSIMMTYFGVNFYLSGLHSYADGDKVVTPREVFYYIGILIILTIFASIKFRKYYKKRKNVS